MHRLFIVITLFLTSCAPGHNGESTDSPPAPGRTGGKRPIDNVPYVSGGMPELDEAVARAHAAPAPTPVTPTAPEPQKPPQVIELPYLPPPSPPVKVTEKLHTQLVQFEMSRFAPEKNNASRFGGKKFVIKIFLSSGKILKFEGPMLGAEPHYSIDVKSGGFALKGTLNDNTPQWTKGNFILTDTEKNQTAEIKYFAFLSSLAVLEDRTQTLTQGSDLEQKLNELKKYSMAWVNNWAVVDGPAFFLLDVVTYTTSEPDDLKETKPFMTISGPSLQTGEMDHQATSITKPEGYGEFNLIGNSETSTRRFLQTQIVDPNTKQNLDIVLDFQQESASTANQPTPDANQPAPDVPPAPQQTPATPAETAAPNSIPAAPTSRTAPSVPIAPQPATSPIVTTPTRPSPTAATPTPPPATQAPAPTPTPARPAPTNVPAAPVTTTQQPQRLNAPTSSRAEGVVTAPTRPAPTVTQPIQRTPTQPPAVPAPAPRPQVPPVAPVITGSSYLMIDNSLPRTSQMSAAFGRPENRNLPGVRAKIANYQNTNINNRDNKVENILNSFYKVANPFRPMIEAIARALDVTPAFAYLSILEAPNYWRGKNTPEYGDGGLAFGPFQFHRAAALESNLKLDGGAGDERQYYAPSACGAARYLGRQTEAFRDSDMTLAILGYNQGTGGANRAVTCTYAGKNQCTTSPHRYRELATKFNVNFASISQVRAISIDQINYVETFLAAYFISSDMQTYGFSIAPNAPSSILPELKAFPSKAIHDPLCNNITQSYRPVK